MSMGSCYGAGAYFFWRVSFGHSWHAVAAYFPGIAVFTWLMGIATFLHWEKFNHPHLAFLAGMSTLLIGGIALDRIIEARVPPAAPASFRA